MSQSLLVGAAVENLERRDFILVLFDEFFKRLHKIGSPISAILGNTSNKQLVFANGVDDLLKGFLEVDKALAQLGVRDDWLGCLR